MENLKSRDEIIFNTNILLIFINTRCSTTESSCPPSVLRKSVSNRSCPVVTNYHCLEVYGTTKYEQECKEYKRIEAGKYPIFDGGHISEISCPSDRYQSKSSSSYEINKCIYEKSLCSEEGQVIYSNGSTTEDRSCRCDYTKGYNFVTPPKEICYCTPSVEDCSCYKHRCPNNNQTLSQDYQCIIDVDSAVFVSWWFVCPKIESVNVQEDDHTKTVTEVKSELPVSSLSNQTVAIVIFIVALLQFLTFYGFQIYFIQYYKKFMEQRFVNDLEDITSIEGDSATYSCEVTNNKAKAVWYKDGVPLQPSKNHEIKSDEGLHTFTIVKTSVIYMGSYSVRIGRLESRPALLILSDSVDPQQVVKTSRKHHIQLEPIQATEFDKKIIVKTGPQQIMISEPNQIMESKQSVELDPVDADQDDGCILKSYAENGDEYSLRNKKKFLRLIEFCYSIPLNVVRAFVESCILKDYNNSLEQFLNTHKHRIYHLWRFNTPCCIGVCTKNPIRELCHDQITKLYDLPISYIAGHEKRGKSVIQYCACGINVRKSCSLKTLDITLIHTVLRHCVKLHPNDDRCLNTIKGIRNKLAHVESFADLDAGRLDKWWNMLEGSVLGLAHELKPSFYDSIERQINLIKKSDLEIRYIDEILVESEAENNS